MKHTARTAATMLAAMLLLLACAAPGTLQEQGAKRPRDTPRAASHGNMEVWRLDELAQQDSAVILLRNSQGIHAAIETRLLRDILATGRRIVEAAGAEPVPEFVIIGSGSVNAFAFFNDQQATIAFSLGMVRLLSADADIWAALIGHELAHLRLEHLRVRQDRRTKAEVAGSLAGIVLSAAGLPFASIVTDASAALADRAYSRDDEREADRVGLEYMRRAGFAESGAITLQQRLQTVAGGTAIPFLSTHPGGEERVENLRQLIRGGE